MSSSSQHSYTGCYFIACFSDTSAVVPREVHLPKPVIYVNLNTNLSRPSVLEQELENMGNATYESYPALNNFVFLCKECRVCWMFHWAPAVNLHTVKNLKMSKLRTSHNLWYYDHPHLDSTEAFGGVEGKCDGEEVIRIAADTELKAAALVVCVNQWVLEGNGKLGRKIESHNKIWHIQCFTCHRRAPRRVSIV